MDDESAIPGPSGLKGRSVKGVTAAKKKNAVPEPSTSGAPEVKKRARKEVKDEAVKNKDVEDKNKDMEDKNKDMEDENEDMEDENEDVEDENEDMEDETVKNEEGKDKAVKNKEVKDKAVKNKEVKDKAVKNKEVKDKAVKNKEVKDKAVKNKEVKDKAVKNKEVKDKAVKNKEVKDKAVNNKGAKSVEPTNKAKTTLEMVCDAINAIGDGKNGASTQAIKSYIQNEKGPEAIVKNFLISKAIHKGIETGAISRAKPKAGATGVSRRFVLVKKEKVVKKKVEKQNSDQNDIVKKSPKLFGGTFVKGMSLTSTPKNGAKSANFKKPKIGEKAAEFDLDDRKESSDTEIVVKPKRKSTKVYLSDTEIDFTINLKEEKKRKTKVAKVKTSQIDTQVKPPKSKGTTKLYSADPRTKTKKTNKTKKN